MATIINTNNTHNESKFNKSKLDSIMKDIFNGQNINMTFENFIDFVENETDNSLCIRQQYINENDKLYLFSNDWNVPNKIGINSPLTKYFNNLVMDNHFKIYMYGGSKVYDSNRDNFNLDDLNKIIPFNTPDTKIYNAYDGPSISVFYSELNDKWYFSTKKKFNMNESFFGSTLSHGQMFNQIQNQEELITRFNKQYTYHFVLSHVDMSHLVQNTNRLILIAIRDRNDQFKLVEHDIKQFAGLNIEFPSEVTDDLKMLLQTEIQGIIIYNDSNIYRIYSDSYGIKLKHNPKFHTVQEELFSHFKNNKLIEVSDKFDNDAYGSTICVINYVSIMLFRLLMHFTKYNKLSEQEPNSKIKFVKQNEFDYEYLKKHNALKRNIYKLQHLPFAIKTINNVDFKQIKYHIKYYCDARDIYAMYLSFTTDTELEKLVKYKHQASLEQKQKETIKQFNSIKYITPEISK
jgi:hypothetical protein